MKVLVLTSGGDAAGMNKFIALISKAFKADAYGARAGFKGLINNDIAPLCEFKAGEYENDAGSCIYSSRCVEFATELGFKKGLKNAKKFDVVIVLGGNGSFKGAKQLAENGVRTIFVPATIDNDVEISEYSMGFHTAVKACCDYYYNTMPSMQAFNRCCVFEVMGRQHDAIAINTANAVGADYVVANKEDLQFDKISKVVKAGRNNGQAVGIIIRENIMPLSNVTSEISKRVKDADVKGVAVGYLQRGTKPTKVELKFASEFAGESIKAIKKKEGSFAVIFREGKVIATAYERI